MLVSSIAVPHHHQNHHHHHHHHITTSPHHHITTSPLHQPHQLTHSLIIHVQHTLRGPVRIYIYLWKRHSRFLRSLLEPSRAFSRRPAIDLVVFQNASLNQGSIHIIHTRVWWWWWWWMMRSDLPASTPKGRGKGEGRGGGAWKLSPPSPSENVQNLDFRTPQDPKSPKIAPFTQKSFFHPFSPANHSNSSQILSPHSPAPPACFHPLTLPFPQFSFFDFTPSFLYISVLFFMQHSLAHKFHTLLSHPPTHPPS